MNLRNLLIFLGMLAIAGAVSYETLLADHVTGMRAVKIQISVDGDVILERGMGDDGHPDADEVWGYLKGLGMVATERFPEHDPEEDGKQLEINGDINVKITYGGEINVKRLTLNFAPDAERERNWTLNEEWVDDKFASRLISRRLASRLNNQKIRD